MDIVTLLPAILTSISDVGFPVIAFLILFVVWRKDKANYSRTLESLQTSLDGNTESINKLVGLIIEIVRRTNNES